MRKRNDLKVKKWIDVIGAVLALYGFAGIGCASEGHGNLMVAIGIFAVGFAIVLWGYQR